MSGNNYVYRSNAVISIILPAFNEEKRIPSLLDALRSISVDPQRIEVIVVDDGSTDSTSTICRQFIEDFFPMGKVITKPQNTGKGSALRVGVMAANAPKIITMDADMATDLSAIEPAIKGLDEHDIVVGSRSIEGSQTQGITSSRKFVTLGFSLLLRMLTKHKIADTQCGFKVYRSPVAKILFSASHVKGFAQDAEILDLAYRHNFSILEIPVRWESIPDSKVNLIRDSMSSLLEFVGYRLNASKIQEINGLRISLEDGKKKGVNENDILGSFASDYVYIRSQSSIDILMPGVCSDELKKISEAFHTNHPGSESQICICSLDDLFP